MMLSGGVIWRVAGLILSILFFFKQKTAYEMRISDWSSDVCSSDLVNRLLRLHHRFLRRQLVVHRHDFKLLAGHAAGSIDALGHVAVIGEALLADRSHHARKRIDKGDLDRICGYRRCGREAERKPG